MSWWGKVLGGAVGFAIGGPLGALLGAAVGHNFDRGGLRAPPAVGAEEQARIQTAFFTATFTVMGALAKADGRVSEREIAAARAIMARMQLDAEQERTAVRLFQEGKQPDFPLDEVLDQLRRECRRRTGLIRMFIEIQLTAAYADGEISAPERALLLHICDRLGISRWHLEAMDILVRAQQQAAAGGARGAGGRQGSGRGRREPGLSVEDAYKVLELSPEADEAQVKRAYRRLLSQHHPDKLVARGLPEEMMKLAGERTHQIRSAYERIREARGWHRSEAG